MADEAKATLEKLRKLQEKLIEVQDQERAIVEEMGNLLSGGPGIGAILKRLESHFSECWQVRYRAPYAFQFAKDVPQLKRLIKLIGVEELERRMLRYLRNDEAFFLKARHSFGAFVSSVNQHTDPDRSQERVGDLDLSNEADQTSRMLSTMRAAGVGRK
jgi:hypothetical protein